VGRSGGRIVSTREWCLAKAALMATASGGVDLSKRARSSTRAWTCEVSPTTKCIFAFEHVKRLVVTVMDMQRHRRRARRRLLPRLRRGKNRRSGLHTRSADQESVNAAEDQWRSAATAAMTADIACHVWTTLEYRPSAQTVTDGPGRLAHSCGTEGPMVRARAGSQAWQARGELLFPRRAHMSPIGLPAVASRLLADESPRP